MSILLSVACADPCTIGVSASNTSSLPSRPSRVVERRIWSGQAASSNTACTESTRMARTVLTWKSVKAPGLA